jgi:WD40 repeat protein
VSFTPDGQMIALADRGILKLWSLDGILVKTLFAFKRDGVVSKIAFSPDSKQIVTTGNSDYSAQLWTLDGRLVATLSGHRMAIAGLTFSPDGKTIASASYDGTVKLWNSADGTLINTISDHSAGAGDVKFSPDGQMVASSGVHSKVKIWKLDGTLVKNIHRTSGSCN